MTGDMHEVVPGQIHTSYIHFVFVCDQTGGGTLERMQIFVLAKGLNLEFLALLGRESSSVDNFCESCVHLTFPIHPYT